MSEEIPLLLRDKEIGLRVPGRVDAPHFWRMRNDLNVAAQLISYNRGVSLPKVEAWIDGLRDSDDPLIFTAVLDRAGHQTPIGFVKAFRFDRTARTCWAGLSLFDLNNAGRGHGAGMFGLLISYLERWQGTRKVSVEVLANNAAAIALYRKLGFVEEGRLRAQYHLDGALHDVLLMSWFSSINA